MFILNIEIDNSPMYIRYIIYILAQYKGESSFGHIRKNSVNNNILHRGQIIDEIMLCKLKSLAILVQTNHFK